MNFNIRIMRIVLLLTVLFCCRAYAQGDFSQLKQFIEQQVRYHSVPFSASGTLKVSGIALEEDGAATVSYSEKKAPVRLHLTKLYAANKFSSGIELGNGANSRLLMLHQSEDKITVIRFDTHGDAVLTFSALQSLQNLLKYKKQLTATGFEETVSAINAALERWATAGGTRITATRQGDIAIFSLSKPAFRFNLFELSKNPVHSSDAFGIDAKPCSAGAAAEISWINFYAGSETKGFLKLRCMPAQELLKLHRLFVQLRSQMQPEKLPGMPADGKYYINNATQLSRSNDFLFNSLRPLEKKDEGSVTHLVASSGEGWLNQDSIPVGNWRFFALDPKGAAYVFKSGSYQPTSSNMFDVAGIDSATAWKDHGVSFTSVKANQVTYIPFVKVREWNYHHTNGARWKSPVYMHNFIPVYLDVVISTDALGNPTGSAVTVKSKEDPDEWLSGQLIEYSSDGKIYKTMSYYGASAVYNKTVYDSKGIIVTSEKAGPYDGPLQATHF